MHRKALAILMTAAFSCSAASTAFAAEPGVSASLRVGIPTDVLVNLGSLYSFGLALEASVGFQVLDWLIVGGVAGYGFGSGISVAPPFNSYIDLAARVGIGSIREFSGSLILGVAYIPLGATPIIPDIGISVDWRFLSLAASTGSISIGTSFTF
jgi:hypothetical protein